MAINNVVLVHGNFADGSGWRSVYDHLTADGYRVAVVQNPTLSLGGDVAAAHAARRRRIPGRTCGTDGTDKAIGGRRRSR